MVSPTCRSWSSASPTSTMTPSSVRSVSSPSTMRGSSTPSLPDRVDRRQELVPVFRRRRSVNSARAKPKPTAARHAVDRGHLVGHRRRGSPTADRRVPTRLCTTKSPSKPRDTSDSTDVLADAANTVMNPTRATLMSSAEAVAEVRLGLRAAFSAASRPVTPFSRGRSAPSARMDGAASTGPDDDRGDDHEHRARSPTGPRSSVSLPSRPAGREVEHPEGEDRRCRARSRTRDAPERSMATSRRAASGGTRVERMAGTRAAMSVDAHADDERDHHGGRPDGQPVGGEVGAERRERGRDALGQPDAGGHAEHRGHHAHEHRLEEHRAQHLAAARPDGAQQGQLARALGHEDREGVRDHEDADEQRDPAEHLERDLEELEPRLHVATTAARRPPRR